MGFLRRLFRSDESAGPDAADADVKPVAQPATEADLDQAERQHELEVLKEEQRRLDELQQRQLRYADYVWEPPAQGGERRADDAEVGRDGG
jgi:hypothetical protein